LGNLTIASATCFLSINDCFRDPEIVSLTRGGDLCLVVTGKFAYSLGLRCRLLASSVEITVDRASFNFNEFILTSKSFWSMRD